MEFKDKHKLPSDQYEMQETKKDVIIWHHTAGPSIEGVVSEWKRTPEKVCTAFVIEKDGTIYQMFDEKYWGRALGIKGDNNATDKRAIQIELCNEGVLQLRDTHNLNFWPMNFGKKFCDISETSKYYKIDKPWRGFQYFTSYPEAQLQSLANLTKFLCDKHKISCALPPEDKWGVTDIKFFAKYSGIACHTSWRTDKFDFGPEPCFPWKKMKELLEK